MGQARRVAGTCVSVLALALTLSAMAAVTPWAALAVPLPPTVLVAAPGAADPVVADLAWLPPADPTVTEYRVYSSTKADGPYALAGVTRGNSFTFSGFGALPYYFRVTAVDAIGGESLSPQVGPVAGSWTDDFHAVATSATKRCGKCHRPHSAPASVLLREASVATCALCHSGQVAAAADVFTHDGDSFALASGHTLAGTGPGASLVSDCASCHTPHGDPALTPLLPAGKVAGTPVSGSGPEWCYACHDDANSWFGPGYPAAAAPTRDASGYPVSGTWPGRATYAGTTNAHRLIPETTQTAASGLDFLRKQGDCLNCHAAHRGPNRYDSLSATFAPTSASTLASDQATGDYAASCFTCHGGVVPSGFTTAPANIKQFVTSSAASPTAGHKVITAGGLLPAGAPLPCYECHGPHGSSRGNTSLISDALGGSLSTTGAATNVRAFCFSCHTTSDTVKSWDSTASAYSAVSASDTVVGLRRDGGIAGDENALHLPTALGHRESDTLSCYDCHGSSYATGGNNVHAPSSSGGYDPGLHTSDETCVATCHSPELGPTHDALPLPVACTDCHAVAVPAISPWDKTCSACHPSYPTSHPSAVTTSVIQPLADHLGTDAGVRAVRTNGNGCSDTPANSQTGCHSLADIGTVHYLLPDRGCTVCHGVGDTPAKECITCHPYLGTTTARSTPNRYPTGDDSMTAAGSVFPAAPATRWDKVDDPANDSDATYVTFTGAGRVTFSNNTTPSIPVSSTIANVAVYYTRRYVTGTGTLPANMGASVKVGGNYYNQATPVNATAGYGSASYAFTTNPKTGVAWTLNDIIDPSSTNGLQGFGVFSTDAAPNVRLTRIYIVINYNVNPFSGFPIYSQVYHHNNSSYLLNPADNTTGNDYYPGNPPNGWSAKYWQDCNAKCHSSIYGAPSWTPYAGGLMWYSLAGQEQFYPPANVVRIPEERTLTLDAGTLPASAQLSFKTRWEFTGGGVATGYVEASTNGGSSWTPLTGTVHGVSRASLTGNSPASWGDAVYDLSAYAGQDTQLRFRYSMPTYNYGAGWAIDNVTISDGSTIFFDDAESPNSAWTAVEWYRESQAYPY